MKESLANFSLNYFKKMFMNQKAFFWSKCRQAYSSWQRFACCWLRWIFTQQCLGIFWSPHMVLGRLRLRELAQKLMLLLPILLWKINVLSSVIRSLKFSIAIRGTMADVNVNSQAQSSQTLQKLWWHLLE